MNTRRPLLGLMGTATLGAGLSGALALVDGSPPPALAAVSSLTLAVSLTVASARPDLQVFGPAVCRGAHPGRLALTFDDGPDPASTPHLLDTLAAHRATATFFVLADRAQQHPALLQAIVGGGHEVALHGLHHDPWLTVLPPARGATRLRTALSILHEHGAPPIRWFRPPFGAVSPRVYAAVALVGLDMVWCTIRPGDGGPASPDRIRARCARAVATDIVLLHEGPRHARRLLGSCSTSGTAAGSPPPPSASRSRCPPERQEPTHDIAVDHPRRDPLRRRSRHRPPRRRRRHRAPPHDARPMGLGGPRRAPDRPYPRGAARRRRGRSRRGAAGRRRPRGRPRGSPRRRPHRRHVVRGHLWRVRSVAALHAYSGAGRPRNAPSGPPPRSLPAVPAVPAWRQLPTRAVAARYGLGPTLTTSVACASGAMVFVLARAWLRSGRCERVIVAGLDTLSLYIHAGFAGLGALSPTTCRPFTTSRDGLLLGEGAAAFLVETPAAARAAGRAPRARLLGAGMSQDGVHLTAPDRTGDGLYRAAAAALADAGLPVTGIDTVSAHGTGTIHNDAMEARALSRLFDHAPVPLHLIKPVIGHTLGAAGALEVAEIIALFEGATAPTPPSDLAEDCPIRFTPTRSGTDGRPQTALTVNAAFGGVNVALVFGRGLVPCRVMRLGPGGTTVRDSGAKGPTVPGYVKERGGNVRFLRAEPTTGAPVRSRGRHTAPTSPPADLANAHTFPGWRPRTVFPSPRIGERVARIAPGEGARGTCSRGRLPLIRPSATFSPSNGEKGRRHDAVPCRLEPPSLKVPVDMPLLRDVIIRQTADEGSAPEQGRGAGLRAPDAERRGPPTFQVAPALPHRESGCPCPAAPPAPRVHISGDTFPLASLLGPDAPAPVALGRSDTYVRAGIAALAQAHPASDTPIVLSSETGCAAADLRYYDGLLRDGPARASRLHFAYTTPGAPLAEAAILLHLRGPAVVICGPSADGADTAHALVAAGHASTALHLHIEAPASHADATVTRILRASP